MNEWPTVGDFVAWNEAMAQKYDPEDFHLRSNILVRWVAQRRLNSVVQMVGGEPGDDILEVGCGAGNVLEAVPAGRLTGFDLSMTMMRKARRRLRSRTSRLALANAEAIPLPDNSYDKLLCSDVLEHCRNPAIVIDEICRVAKPGAAVVLSVPNEGLIRRFKQFACCSWLSRVVLRGGYSPPRRMEWHLHDFDLALLREITAHKLTLVELQAIPLNIIPLYYVAKYRA